MKFENLSVSWKIGIVVGVLALIGVGIGVLGVVASATQERLTAAIVNASDRALAADRVNAQVFSVVSDSRGVYMSQTSKEAEKFAVPLLAALDNIRSLMGEWKTLIPVAERQIFAEAEAKVAEFVKFRTELVRLGREVSTFKAREWGDNDANRENRKALNARLAALSETNAARIPVLRAEIETFNDNVGAALIALPLVGLAAGALLAWWISSRHIVRPIRELTGSMNLLAKGDLSTDVADTTRRDEIGDMARTLLVFKDNMIHARKMDEESRRESATRLERARSLQELADHFNGQVGDTLRGVAKAIDRLSHTSEVLTSTAEATTKRGQVVATAGERTHMGVQAVAAATEELTASIEEISRQVASSMEVTREAVAQADEAEERVRKLNGAADRIGEVVQLINSIASRTNLLALNATIEAARAGESGKGFAVVAGEVKHLADQTARATGDIARHIAEIQTGSHDTAESISSVGGIIQRVNMITSAIAAAIEEQGAATREIARNIGDAARGTEEVSANIDDVNTAARGTGDAANDVRDASGLMSREAETLRGVVHGFLERVKTC